MIINQLIFHENKFSLNCILLEFNDFDACFRISICKLKSWFMVHNFKSKNYKIVRNKIMAH